MNLQNSFLAIGCLDLAKSVEFYQALLKQPPSACVAEKYAKFQLPGLQLALFVPDGAQLVEFTGAAGPMSLCLEVADLEAAIAHLTAIGWPPGPIQTASHGREAYVFDPQGNRLILYESR